MKKIKIDGGDIAVDIQLGYPAKTQHEILKKLIADALAALPGAGRVNVEHDAEDHVARGAARREADPGREEHHRRRQRQGRRRQVDHRGQPRAGAGRRRRERRHARRRHLRAVAADDAGHRRPARIDRRQDARAARSLRPAGDVDRLPDRRRHADGLARADGDAGAGATAEGHQLARPRLPRRRPAAGHRRHPADAGAEGAGHRRRDRHHAAGHRAASTRARASRCSRRSASRSSASSRT